MTLLSFNGGGETYRARRLPEQLYHYRGLHVYIHHAGRSYNNRQYGNECGYMGLSAYISGKRLDGCMGISQFITSPVTTVTALFVPFLYRLVGFTSDWNILYDDGIRTNVLLITTIISVVANIVGIIPS